MGEAPASASEIFARSDLPVPLAAPLPDDPLGVTIHRLGNGMTVYISTMRDQPRVAAWIAVRAGSRHDPPHATGLAHYLEHMILFKGSDDIGTVDHRAELPHLQRTRELYRELGKAKDAATRHAVLGELDAVTRAIAKTTIANEKTRLFEQLGFLGTNAFTNTERTHYLSSVPSNRIGQWAALEAEQLADPTFRLFFAELEAVYEEKNQAIDRPESRELELLRRTLFPEHRYGASVLGSPEHLATPDYDAMLRFFEERYVPNNMAVILVGDVDASVVPTLENYFGALTPGELPEDDDDRIVPLPGRVGVELRAPGEGAVTLAWPTVSVHHADAPALELLDALLDDPRVGALAQQLVRPGKVAWAGSWYEHFHEAGYHAISAPVRDDGDHAATEAALRDAVARLVERDVDPPVLESIKLRVVSQRMAEAERSTTRAARILDAFVRHQSWPDAVAAARRFETVTAAELRAVAQRYFGDAFVAVHRKTGAAEQVPLRKPTVTALEFAKQERSRFAGAIASQPVVPITPVFLEPGRDFDRVATAFGEVTGALNRRNDLYEVVVEYDRGFRQDALLCHAVAAWNGAGTPELPPDALQQRLFELGAAVRGTCDSDRTRIQISGIDRGDRFVATIALVQQWLAQPILDPARLGELTRTTTSARRSALDDDGELFAALLDLAYFGDESPARNLPTIAALERATAATLVKSIASAARLRHHVTYFGPRPVAEVAPSLQFGRGDRTPAPLWTRRYRKTMRPEIHVVHRGSAKATIHVVLPSNPLTVAEQGAVAVAHEHLETKSFQQLRVAQSLGYIVDAGVDAGRRGDDAARWGIIAAQPDKAALAIAGMIDVLASLPTETSRQEARARVIEARRAIRTDPRAVAQTVARWRDLGVTEDPSAMLWAQLPGVDGKAIEAISPRAAPIVAIVGDTNRMDLAALGAVGTVIIHPPTELFSD
jgi:predicted Zn-dependent peptidase